MGKNIITDPKEIAYALKHILDSNLEATGNWFLEHRRDGKILHSAWEPNHNTFTTEGLALMHNVLWGSAAKPSQIYCGLFKNNITPALADTALAKLGSGGTYGECQDADYDSPATDRALFEIAATTTAVATNAAAKCEFVMANAAGITLYGGFLCTAAAKTATTGTLICAKAFATARAVADNDEISVGHTITFTSS